MEVLGLDEIETPENNKITINKELCSVIELYERDYYLMKLRNMAQIFCWRSPQYNLKAEKNPGKLCIHRCQLTVDTEPMKGFRPPKTFPCLNRIYEFNTNPETFIIPYDAMEHVAKKAYYTMRDLTGGEENV